MIGRGREREGGGKGGAEKAREKRRSRKRRYKIGSKMKRKEDVCRVLIG